MCNDAQHKQVRQRQWAASLIALRYLFTACMRDWWLQDGYLGLGGWLVRDMPYDFITMQENILDPAHTMFAHHGLLGTRQDATAFGMRPKQALTLDNGFSLALDSSTRKYKVRPHSPVTTAHIRTLSYVYA